MAFSGYLALQGQRKPRITKPRRTHALQKLSSKPRLWSDIFLQRRWLSHIGQENSVPQQSSFIVLKFQRNRAKPELIRILFVTPLDLVDSRKDAIVPQATEKHGHNTSGHFSKKKARIIVGELQIEWENLFRTFLE